MPGDDVEQRIDEAQYRASLARLEAIFRDMSNTAAEVSTWRCPYKNAENRCTAGFGCRNQDRSVAPDELFICLSDDKLDYRSAWET